MKKEMVFRAWDSGYGSVGVSVESSDGEIVWGGYISPQLDPSTEAIDWYVTEWPMQTDGYFVHKAIKAESDPFVREAMRSVYRYLWLPHEVVEDIGARIEVANGTTFDVEAEEGAAVP